MEKPDTILSFWFGTLNKKGKASTQNIIQWYKKNPLFDACIKKRFGYLIPKARRGTLDQWKETPRGLVSLIIVLDQFSRNIFRDSKKAFVGDKKALSLTLYGIKKGMDKDMPYHMKQFLYTPLMHSENLAMQKLSLKKFKELDNTLLKKRSGRSFAKMHYNIIKQFGRFPHRNKILKRKSTVKELQYLSKPGTGF